MLRVRSERGYVLEIVRLETNAIKEVSKRGRLRVRDKH